MGLALWGRDPVTPTSSSLHTPPPPGPRWSRAPFRPDSLCESQGEEAERDQDEVRACFLLTCPFPCRSEACPHPALSPISITCRLLLLPRPPSPLLIASHPSPPGLSLTPPRGLCLRMVFSYLAVTRMGAAMPFPGLGAQVDVSFLVPQAAAAEPIGQRRKRGRPIRLLVSPDSAAGSGDRSRRRG